METNTYRTTLEEEKQRLISELSTVGRPNPANPNDWEAVPQEVGLEADPVDRADQFEHLGDNEAILKDLEIRLALVNDALSRIEDDTYGRCAVCGEEIEIERLAADAAAPTCKAHLGA